MDINKDYTKYMTIGAFTLEPAVYHDMKLRGESPVPCYGCGKVLLAVRDIRKPAYCINCEYKKDRLKRYTNRGHMPTKEERQHIFSGSWRAS